MQIKLPYVGQADVHQGSISTSRSETVSGLSFRPSILILMACDTTPTNLNWSLSFCVGTVRNGMYYGTNGTRVDVMGSNSIVIYRDVSNNLTAGVITFNADGYSFTTTLTGICGVSYTAIAIK